ncbi:alkanesulfonate monooxygenase SsuD/methylene tetrahydromethanopterin reductase-like flavin-dependent oxidoreductase (luciferase family) [Actinocorallia herbida]|uniref:Alkanesulfonate monooxygenase SsuD/methylene tetrahydromethanopterin reductase-like flavin-dependent oxidoreductase (Luciferase family) n=1 Tax=Actinocorallia herbida TaxID=58109 RepID=A0A3N1D3C0_9ACTN|nr:LLM class flavin-dependent oxidoreductase [Actinocorallia herbida]ROO88009.1 alkanesulfonate monooxygenase SsuD/methylene tetrahydromethanopterin reductase-like flavin-dependent oxidoreductase (luciferase family) [Actinocorallia herbida]
MELGVLSLSDLQTDPATGRLHDAGCRTREIVSYAVAADQAGLDVFALGEHHSPDFAVANPAIPLAAAAQATTRIRLTSAVSVLSTLDPVRLHQDFASLDLVSDGRAEIIAGRSAFLEAFALAGVDPADYDRVFADKLDLLLAIRDRPDDVSYAGPSRPPMRHLPVPPYPQQEALPLWIGVGGSPASIERAAQLGLPMVLGLIGGDIRRARALAEHYRQVGAAAGHDPAALRFGLTSHFYVGRTSQQARSELYPYYREYLRPKTPGGRGWLIGPADFENAAGPYGALMTGSPQEVIDKILTEHALLRHDRFMGQIDLGGLPATMVRGSLELFATEVAPIIRKEIASPPAL